MNTHPDITRLLNAARTVALAALGPVPATRDNLDRLASNIRAAIGQQVLLGAWAKFRLTTLDDVAGLAVSTRLGSHILGEPAICVAYDFKRTPLALLRVESVKPKET